MFRPAAPPQGSADSDVTGRQGQGCRRRCPVAVPAHLVRRLRRRWSAPRPRRGRPGHRAVPRCPTGAPVSQFPHRRRRYRGHLTGREPLRRSIISIWSAAGTSDLSGVWCS